jgi:predicted DCC family thiol-disulfide oxidoreductase YuxK
MILVCCLWLNCLTTDNKPQTNQYLYIMNDLHQINHPIIFFDGVCNLCIGSVQFIIKHDPKHYFRFASLQSEIGQQILQQYNLPTAEFGSFILWEKGKVYTKSSAALRVTKNLNALWSGLYAFIIIPPLIRNAVYNLVAKNRYQWFGKKEECWIPTKELNSLFLD